MKFTCGFEIIFTSGALIAILCSGCGTTSPNPSNTNSEVRLSHSQALLKDPVAQSQSGKGQSMDRKAVDLVSRAIRPNKLGITSADLATKDNPRGDGTFVYVPQTRFFGVERNVIWMVTNSTAFALNSPAKMVTPSLPWPREAHDDIWAKTKIDKYIGANEAKQIIYQGDSSQPAPQPQVAKKAAANSPRKLRMSEDKRRQIFKEMVDAEDKARAEADSQYSPETDINNNLRKGDELVKEYTAKVREKHGLTEEQAEELSNEGVEGHWPPL